MNQPAVKELKLGRLARVVSGKLDKPMRIVLYATDGLGKSTWASNAPAPIFVGAEDGTARLDVKRMPDTNTWRDILEAFDELAVGGHDYRTAVLDTADWAEPLCWAYVASAAKKQSIEDLPYGKGYTAALDQWRLLLSKLERLRARGMHVIILAHTWIKTFKNPESDDFDRYEMKLHPKASGLLREWADVVLFGNYETFTDDSTGRSKGISTGARVVHTQRTAAFDAKNRYDLPQTLPLDWSAFAKAVSDGRPIDVTSLRNRINGAVFTYREMLGEETVAKIESAFKEAGDDAAQLARVLDRLNATISIKKQESQS